MHDVLHDTLDDTWHSRNVFAQTCFVPFCSYVNFKTLESHRISRHLDQVVPTVLGAPGVLVPLRRRPFGQWGDTRPFATRVVPCPSRLAQRWVSQVLSGSLIFAYFCCLLQSELSEFEKMLLHTESIVNGCKLNALTSFSSGFAFSTRHFSCHLCCAGNQEPN